MFSDGGREYGLLRQQFGTSALGTIFEFYFFIGWILGGKGWVSLGDQDTVSKASNTPDYYVI